MDLYAFTEFVTRLKMWPVFEINHYALMSLNLKKDLLKTVPFAFERRHPLASWVATLMLCFAGAIFTCILLGKPLATIFASHEKIAAASAAWYLINFIPGVFPVLSSRPAMMVIILIKEIQRVHGIHSGVQAASKEFPDLFLVHFILGFIKGCGAEVMMFFARLTAGVMKVNTHQFSAPNVFLHPSSVFKASAIISSLFVMEARSLLTNFDHDVLFCSITLALVCVRLPMVWGLIGDPFGPFENLLCSLAFGGMWDAFQRAVNKDAPPAAGATRAARANHPAVTKSRSSSGSSYASVANGNAKYKRH